MANVQQLGSKAAAADGGGMTGLTALDAIGKGVDDPVTASDAPRVKDGAADEMRGVPPPEESAPKRARREDRERPQVVDGYEADGPSKEDSSGVPPPLRNGIFRTLDDVRREMKCRTTSR